MSRGRRPTGAAALALAAACSDFSVETDPAAGLPDVAVAVPSFRADVQPILTRRCAFGGCHSAASRQGALVLVPDSAYDALVNRPSSLNPVLVRVRPGRADSSWLHILLGPDDEPRLGVSRMPLASMPLTPNQIATMANWINRGAPRD